MMTRIMNKAVYVGQWKFGMGIWNIVGQDMQDKH